MVALAKDTLQKEQYETGGNEAILNRAKYSIFLRQSPNPGLFLNILSDIILSDILGNILGNILSKKMEQFDVIMSGKSRIILPLK